MCQPGCKKFDRVTNASHNERNRVLRNCFLEIIRKKSRQTLISSVKERRTELFDTGMGKIIGPALLQ